MSFIEEFLSLFSEMAIYLLLGFAIAGLLRSFFSDNVIAKHLGRKSVGSNALASLFGVPLPLCTCGVVPTGVSLLRQGASKGSVISFLTSTAQTGMDNLLVTYAFIGWPFAIFKLVAALITGLVGGSIYDMVSHTEMITPNTSKDGTGVTRIRSVREYLEYSFVDLVRSLRQWLIIGIILAAALAAFVPDNIVDLLGFSNGKIVGYLAILLISSPMYVCATASIPIAAAFLAKGFPPGSAIIFLMAGPATNIATLTVLWKSIGRRATLVYLANIIVCSIAFAYIFDGLFPNYASTMGHVHQHDMAAMGGFWQTAAAITLAILIINTYVQDFLNRRRSPSHSSSGTVSLKVTGLSCQNCVSAVKKGLKSVDGVSDVQLDVAGNCHIAVTKEIPIETLGKIVNDLGYGISRPPT